MVSISWFPSNNHHILVISITIFHLVYISSKPYIYIHHIYIPNISRWNPHLPGWLSSLKRRSQGDLWGCWFWDVRAPGCCLQRIHGFFNGTYLQSGIIKQERWDSSILFFSWCWLKVLFPRDRNGGPVLQHMFFQSLQRDFLADFANSWEFINGIATNLEYLNQRSISHIHPPV